MEFLSSMGFLLPRRDFKDVTEVSYPAYRPGPLRPRSNHPVGALNMEIMRRVSHRGGEWKNAFEPGATPCRWPLLSVPIAWWSWNVCLSYRASGAHINALELRAVLATVKWLTRQKGVCKANIVHFIDSQVVYSMITKGRSSSRFLNGMLRRLNCLLIAADLNLTVGYVRSADNPADAPSHWITKPS